MDYLRNNSKVHMRDPAEIARKLDCLALDGTSKLMIITDFDYTLSRFIDDNGEKCWTTHGVFDSAISLTNPEIGRQLINLRLKYGKIEIDPNMSVSEKIPFMEDWWKKSHNLIVESKFSRSYIEEMVSMSKIKFRTGAEIMIRNLNRLGIPVIVFSAGIGDIIELFIKKKLCTVPENVHIISNMMKFDENDIVDGFDDPLIHTFCKNSSVLAGKPLIGNMASGTNVILMGDTIGDVNMNTGIKNLGIVLKIGFLNSNVNELLSSFLKEYDIVVTNDQSMNVPICILRRITNESSQSILADPLTNVKTDRSGCHLTASESDEKGGNEKNSNAETKVKA